MRAPNLNYLYNVEYFDEIFRAKDEAANSGELEKRIGQLNEELIGHRIQSKKKTESFSQLDGFYSFDLTTTYPGLLIGIGYSHDVSETGAIKTGFSLDYVTGEPYLPGSSLKGQIKSWFPDKDNEQSVELRQEKTELIRSFLGEEYSQLDIDKLREWIFHKNKVVFLGGFLKDSTAPLAMDYITPHNKGKFKNPVPINIMRIKPGIRFQFCFLIPDYAEQGVTAEQIEDLFREIILFGGIGAKTNTGYGRMVDEQAGRRKKQPVKIGICPKCGKDVMWENDAPYCSGHCGLRMGEVHHVKLTKAQMRDFLAGNVIEIVNERGQKERCRKGIVKQVFSKKTGKRSEIIDAVRI